MKQRIPVPPLSAPERLDKFLIRHFPNSGRQYWRDHLETSVRVDGKKAAKGLMLRGGEALELSELPPTAGETLAANPDIPLKILYQDEWLFAVDKPAGLPCHPLRRGETETLANAALAAFPKQAELQPAREAGLVHRLDNETSGVVLFARNQAALEQLRGLSQAGGILKTYLTLVEGRLTGEGEIQIPIGHHAKNSKKMIAVADIAQVGRTQARAAFTKYESLKSSDTLSLLRVEIRVGARHQIRVHLASLGHPILGDRVYGAEDKHSRYFLHAAEIRFTHPWIHQEIRIAAPAPKEFQALEPRD